MAILRHYRILLYSVDLGLLAPLWLGVFRAAIRGLVGLCVFCVYFVCILGPTLPGLPG